MKTDAINRAPLAADVAAAVTTVQLFTNSATPTLPAICAVEGSGVLEQYEFEIAASGRVTTVGAYTVIIGLYAATVVPATPLVAANWTLIGASTARAVGTTTCPFFYRAHFIADALSGKLHGTFGACINNLVDAPAALSSVITGVNLASSLAEPALVFALGVTFSTGNVANVGHLNYFGVEC